MDDNAVTLNDLVVLRKRLELGCFACRLHLYIDASILKLPGGIAVPDVAALLRCPQCGAENREPGYPLWVRPDARPPEMGATNIGDGTAGR